MSRKMALLLGALAAAGLLFPARSPAFETISRGEVEKLVEGEPQAGTYRLIDVRADSAYFAGHIPGAVSIPWQELNERSDELSSDQATPLIFYGDGECDHCAKSAEYAESLGYPDVFVFREGLRAWEQAAPLWVAADYLKMLISDRDKVAVIVDVRPFDKYHQGTVPGAVNIPWQEWDKRKGTLPADQATELIFFCGGRNCDLSHRAAAAARTLGYTRVRTYAYGWPDWEKNSTRAFALIEPRQGRVAAAGEPEPALYPGEIARDEFLELIEKKPADLLLVDVRSAEEFDRGHLPGAVNIPGEKVDEQVDRLKDRNVIFYCNQGSRCAAAYYAAEDAGVKGTRFLNRAVAIEPDGSFSIE